MRARSEPAALLLAWALLTGGAQAHEGHDHGGGTVIGAGATGSRNDSVATGDHAVPVGTAAPSGLAGAVTLRDCVRAALDGSHVLRAARVDVEDSRNSLAEARMALTPTAQLDGLYQQTPEPFSWTVAVGISATVPLFEPGTLAETRSARDRLEAAEETYTSLRNQVLVYVASAFLITQGQEEMVAAAERNHSHAELHLRFALRMLEAERATRLEVLDAEGELAAAARGLALARQQQAIWKARLGAASGIAAALEDWSIQRATLELPVDLGTWGIRAHPDIQIEQISLGISRRSRRAAVAGFGPSLQGGLLYAYDPYRSGFPITPEPLMVGSLSLTMPLVDARSRRTALQQARLGEARQAVVLEATRTDRERRYVEALRALDALQVVNAADTRTVRARREATELARDQFARGQVTGMFVTDAIDQLFVAEREQAADRTLLDLAVLELAQLEMRLDEVLRISAP